MVEDYMLEKILENIKEITGFEKFDEIKILIDMDDLFSDDISFKNIVILMTYLIKDGNKLYPQLFLEGALHDK